MASEKKDFSKQIATNNKRNKVMFTLVAILIGLGIYDFYFNGAKIISKWNSTLYSPSYKSQQSNNNEL